MFRQQNGPPAQGERGQALIVLVFATVALLLFAGLAIDGGAAILGRRRMQNAADAAALAGARELAVALCDRRGSADTDATVRAQVAALAQGNGISDPEAIQAYYVRFVGSKITDYNPPRLVGAGAVPQGAVGVRTTAVVTQATYFLSLGGQAATASGAEATAVTGPPLFADGIRPYGVPFSLVAGMQPGDCFYVEFGNCIRRSEQQLDDDEEYVDDDHCVICDGEFREVGRHRGWFNLSHAWNQSDAPGYPRALGDSAGASELGQWMASGWLDLLYSDCPWEGGCRWGDYVHAKPGANASVIGATPLNTPYVIPLYDAIRKYEDIPGPKAEPVSQGGSRYYHVVGFATVVSPEVNQGDHWIKACLRGVVWGKGQPAPNAGYGSGHHACSSHTVVVSLWR